VPETAEAGAGIVPGGEPGRIDTIRIGSERAQQGADASERLRPRPLLGQQVLGRAEELLETRLGLHAAIIQPSLALPFWGG